MRRADLGQRVHPVNHRLQLLAKDELQHLVQLAHAAQERPKQAPLLAEQVTQIDSRVVAGGGAAGDQAPAGRQRFQALGPGRHARVLHHHIHAALAGDPLHFG